MEDVSLRSRLERIEKELQEQREMIVLMGGTINVLLETQTNHQETRKEHMMSNFIIIPNGDGAWPDLEKKKQENKLDWFGHKVDYTIQLATISHGTTRGLPSVAIRIDGPDGHTLVAEISLALFLTANDVFKAHHGLVPMSVPDEQGIMQIAAKYIKDLSSEEQIHKVFTNPPTKEVQ